MPKLRLHLESAVPTVLAIMLASLYSCASKGTNSDTADNQTAKPEKSATSTPTGSPAVKPLTSKSESKAALPTGGVTPTGIEMAPPPTAPARYSFQKPEHVRGIYLTAWSAGSSRKMDKILAIIDKTELNAVVIDIRDTGDMYWKTGIPLANESHATMVAVAKPAVLFQRLAKHNVWPIARVACFRDNWVPKKHPELAVQLKNGQPWKDRSKHMWLDPYNQKNWKYIEQTVDFALDQGFQEIQLDYVRFPSEGKSATQVFPGRKTYPDAKAKPEDVIASFAKYIGEKVRARNAVFSADIFGIISSNKGNEGIGQQLEKVAAPFDVISPMVYPSHFAKGEYGIKDPNRDPYKIITKSLGDYKKRLPKKPVRPWLQDFTLGYHYGPTEVKAQMKAAHDLGYDDFLLWNAGNRYTESALGPKNP